MLKDDTVAKERRTGAKDPSEDSRSLLLQSAKGLFAKKGFDGVTVRDIADRAGVNLSLISYHFGGKEGLYRACLDQFGRERLAAVERLLLVPNTAEEMKVRIEMFVREMLQGYLDEPDLVTMVQRECEQELPVVEDIFKSTFFKVFDQLKTFLDQCRKKGLIAATNDPHATSAIMFGALIHNMRVDPITVKYFNLSLRDLDYRERYINQLVTTLIGGIT